MVGDPQVRNVAFVLALALASVPASAGDTFTDDFTEGIKDGWVNADAPAVTLVTEGKHRLMHVGKDQAGKLPRLRAVTVPGTWRDFSLEAHMMKLSDGWVGLLFRNGYEVYLADKHRLVLRRKYRVLKIVKTRNEPRCYYHLRVVCWRRDIRIYVNGASVMDWAEQEDTGAGRVGLLVSGTEARFDNFRVTGSIPPDAAIGLTATSPRNALRFEPGKPFAVGLNVVNRSRSAWRARVSAEVLPKEIADHRPQIVPGLRAAPGIISVVNDDGKPALSIGCGDPILDSRIGYRRVPQEDIWDNFYLRFSIRGIGGVYFHESPTGVYEFYLDGAGRFVTRKILPGWKVTVLGVHPKRFSLEGYHHVKIFRRGGELTVLVGDEEILHTRDDSSMRGSIGLYSNRSHARYRDVMITSVLPAKAGTAVGVPKPKIVRTWQADLRHRPRGPQPIAHAASVVDLIADGQTSSTVSLPTLPEGYYFLKLRVTVDGQVAEEVRYPLCIWRLPEARPDEPYFPLIAYGKHDLPRDEVSASTYLHAVCRRLRQAGLNGVIHPFHSRQQLDIVQRYGLRAALRENMIQWSDHPAVPCVLVGDEPSMKHIESYKNRYADLKARALGKPLITCMIGGGAGGGGDADPLRTWEVLQPDVRYLRVYCFRKAAYGMLDPKPGTRPLSDLFSAFQGYDETPWWFVVQTFGKRVTFQRPAPYWRNPNHAEVRGMMNLALAYGAKGLFFYSFQSEGQGPALVRPASLTAEDEKLAAVSHVARKIERIKTALLRMKPTALDVMSDSPEVVARPYQSDGGHYVYVVNLETDGSEDTTVTIKGHRWTTAVDVETEATVTSERTDAGTEIRLQLEPGEGRLLRLR